MPEGLVLKTDKMLARKEGGIATMVFNNPERRNAVSLEMWEAAEAILTDFRDDPHVRVVVVTGAGDKAFVSGADISKFESERNSMEEVERYNAQTARVYDLLYALPKPTIAQIKGACVGGGTALALCCDLRICGADSRFAIPAAKLGLGYGFTSMKRLVDVVGPAFAKEILFTARLFDAEEARAMGLVNRVVPKEQVEATVAEYARTIAENAPLTVTAAKQVINETCKDESARDMAKIAALVAACFASEDYKEGRRAFLEKRKPNFQGR